ncbi:MAG TPA: hypothetical protein DDW50_02635 [Firmicutes bacterium]|jgi:hypothetical protein|nr:hypothetical protein [Bacillota bacterium]
MENCKSDFLDISMTEVSFYPNFQPHEWNKEWLEQFVTYLSLSADYINRYINLKNIPPILFIAPDFRETFILENALPYWLKGVFDGTRICFLIDDKCRRWRQIVNHELFHAAVFQIYESHPVVPVWFNEALAYFVGENINFCQGELQNRLTIEYQSIKRLLLTDKLLTEDRNPYEIIKSFGAFFGQNFSSESIKIFFNELSCELNFTITFQRIFGLTFEVAIDQWHDSIINVLNRKTAENSSLRQELKYLNSFETALVILAKIVKRDYQLMFINYWRGIDADFDDQTLSKRLDSFADDNLSSLEFYHGIRLNLLKPVTAESAWNFIIEELKQYCPVIILTDTYWCPWHEAYGKYHEAYYCLVNGMSESGQYLTCIDNKIFKTKDQMGTMPFYNFKTSFKEIYYYQLLSQSHSYYPQDVFQDVIKQHEMDLKKQPLSNLNDKASLLKRFDDIFRGRYKFAIALQYLADRFDDREIKQFSREMFIISNGWRKVRLYLLKNYQEPPGILLPSIIYHILNIGKREEILRRLMNCYPSQPQKELHDN